MKHRRLAPLSKGENDCERLGAQLVYDELAPGAELDVARRAVHDAALYTG
jgi:hypothetical protein